MMSLQECSQTLNKSGNQYNDAEVKAIRSFMYKMAELSYDLFKQIETDKKLILKRWDQLSRSPQVAYLLIRSLRNMGIKIEASEQPIDFRSAFWNCKLAAYFWDSYVGEEVDFIRN